MPDTVESPGAMVTGKASPTLFPEKPALTHKSARYEAEQPTDGLSRVPKMEGLMHDLLIETYPRHSEATGIPKGS